MMRNIYLIHFTFFNNSSTIRPSINRSESPSNPKDSTWIKINAYMQIQITIQRLHRDKPSKTKQKPPHIVDTNYNERKWSIELRTRAFTECYQLLEPLVKVQINYCNKTHIARAWEVGVMRWRASYASNVYVKNSLCSYTKLHLTTALVQTRNTYITYIYI